MGSSSPLAKLLVRGPSSKPFRGCDCLVCFLLVTSVGAKTKQISVTYNTQMHAVLGTVEKVLQIIYRGRIYELVYTAERTAEETLTMLHDALLKLYTTALKMLAYAANICD